MEIRRTGYERVGEGRILHPSPPPPKYAVPMKMLDKLCYICNMFGTNRQGIMALEQKAAYRK
jgi:hypothetical protein